MAADAPFDRLSPIRLCIAFDPARLLQTRRANPSVAHVF